MDLSMNGIKNAMRYKIGGNFGLKYLAKYSLRANKALTTRPKIKHVMKPRTINLMFL